MRIGLFRNSIERAIHPITLAPSPSANRSSHHSRPVTARSYSNPPHPQKPLAPPITTPLQASPSPPRLPSLSRSAPFTSSPPPLRSSLSAPPSLLAPITSLRGRASPRPPNSARNNSVSSRLGSGRPAPPALVSFRRLPPPLCQPLPFSHSIPCIRYKRLNYLYRRNFSPHFDDPMIRRDYPIGGPSRPVFSLWAPHPLRLISPPRCLLPLAIPFLFLRQGLRARSLLSSVFDGSGPFAPPPFRPLSLSPPPLLTTSAASFPRFPGVGGGVFSPPSPQTSSPAIPSPSGFPFSPAYPPFPFLPSVLLAPSRPSQIPLRHRRRPFRALITFGPRPVSLLPFSSSRGSCLAPFSYRPLGPGPDPGFAASGRCGAWSEQASRVTF